MMKTSMYSWLIRAAVLCFALTMPASGDTPYYTKARSFESQNNWEAAYHAFVQSVENDERVNMRERYRPIDRAFLIATDHLGWFDEAVALAEDYIKEHNDGYMHRLLGYFYKHKLREYDKAREHFERSFEAFLEDDRMFAALYSLEQQAGAYRTQLHEMEYYANRKHRNSYTRKAHNILLKGMPLIDQVENKNDRQRIYTKYLKSLSYTLSHTWYSGHDPELAEQYQNIIDELEGGNKTPYDRAYDTYTELKKEKKYTEAAALWEDYLLKYPNLVGNINFMERLTMCYHRSKDWENTIRTAEITMDLIDEAIEEFTTDIEKAVGMKLDWLATYERAIQAAENLNLHQKTFDYMERSRARAMLDLLSGRDYSKRQEKLTSDEKEIALLEARIDEIKAAIENERRIGVNQDVASLQRSLVIVEDTATKIKRRADIARREILSSSKVDPISTEEAQKLIGDHTLISIWDGIHMSVITKDQVVSRHIRGSSYFDKLIRDFRKAIESQSRRARALVIDAEGEPPPDADDEIMAIAQKLHHYIIAPVEKYFSKDSDKIYIVYDRMHPVLPYQVLHDGESYMAEKYTLIYAPSVSVLQHCMERRQPMGDLLLALGNPDLQNPDYNLAYAEEEVKTLSEMFPDSRVLIGRDANETAVQLLSSDADILHFACHGVIDEDDPMKSHLRLAPDNKSDGYLTVDDIMDLHLQASLVTLSACDTGRGRIHMGGEVLGLTRAWMYAGTPSVLASLWKVDDRATSRLMTQFYANLKKHDKAKSLQLAQLDMIKEGMSPFYWAAFCLYGDYQ